MFVSDSDMVFRSRDGERQRRWRERRKGNPLRRK